MDNLDKDIEDVEYDPDAFVLAGTILCATVAIIILILT